MSTQTSPRPSFIRALRGASPALWPSRMRLIQLKAAYKANAYSGHPEDMLDSIDHQESKIRRHQDGLPPAKTTQPTAETEQPPAPVVLDARNPETLLAELTVRSHKDGGPFQPGLEASEQRLAQMRVMYSAGSYRGHPEGMLEDIEDEENLVRRLKAEAKA